MTEQMREAGREATPVDEAGGDPARRRATIMRTQELPVTGTHIAAFLIRERTTAERYALALGATSLASVVTVALSPHLDRVIFMLLWPAVLFSALAGGLGPAIVSSLLAVLVVDLWVIEPRGAFVVTARDAMPLALFVVSTVAMSSIANALRVARGRAAAATHEMHQLALELEEQAVELEQQLEESQALQEELEQTSQELAARTGEAEAAGAFSRGILASITDPLVVHDADWRFVYINERAHDVFQRSPRGARGSLVGVRLWDAYPDLVGSEHERHMRRAAEERVPVTYEAYYAEAGTWSVMSCYPLQDGGLVTQWKDVTERHRAEETARYLARASEVLGASLDYETTLAELAQVVVPELAEWCTVHVVEEEGAVRQVAVAHADPEKARWAAALEATLRADPEEPRGVRTVLRTGEALLVPEITRDMLDAVGDPERRRLVETLGLRSAIIVPLVARGRVLGALSLFSVRTGRRYGPPELALATELARRAALAVDNSLLHRAERRARVAADEANKAKMQFLAVMSHELRTPLNAIGGYAELLRLGLRGPVTEAQLQDLDRIGASQRNLLGLINDILNFAKIDAGHVEFRVAEVPLAPVLRDLQDLVAPQLAAASLRFDGARCDDGLVVRGDAEKIRQIVLNLLSNAIKFTPAGGRVRIECARGGEQVRVSVVDTGIGIAPDRLETVFDPFVQLDRSLTSQHEGTGLGLSISRDLARAMQGDVVATSEPGRGSTFSLVLPAGSRA